MIKNKPIRQNFIKHFFIAVLLSFVYWSLRDTLQDVSAENYGSILTVSTLLIMAFLFADYAFTFQGTDFKKTSSALLSQLLTGMIIFGTGALLLIVSVTLNLLLESNFFLFNLIAVLFYLSLVLYDFWDLHRSL